MAEVIDIGLRDARQERLDVGGGPPNNGDMNERLAKLEAVMPMLATKGDVADAKTSIISFAATFGGAMAAIVIGILLFAINRASPPTTAQPQPQPIVIQLPATTFQTPPAPTSAVPAK